MPLLFFLFFVSLYAQEKKNVLYLGGDYPSIEFHLGVLSEIERLQIPVDSVVGTDWGAFAGALWSAGWSSGQIRELIKSWDSLAPAKQPLESNLWKKEWLVKNKESGEPVLESMDGKKPYFGQIFFDLRVQEALWRSDIGSRISFRQIDNANNYPFPNSHSPTNRILSTSVALRDTNGASAERYQQKLWSQDSTLLILRPHSKPNPDSLFEAGVRAVQTQRTFFAKINYPSSISYHPSELPPPRFLYHPVFDDISAEVQGHLENFWNPSDTGLLAVRNFLEALQKNGSYYDVKLTLDTSSFLQIKAKNNPQLSLSLGAFGGTLFGANAATNINFRFINQFGYNWNLAAFYGQGAKGAEPEVRFERFFFDDGDFFTKIKLFEYEPTSFFQKSIDEKARLLKERGSGAVLGVEKPLGEKRLLQIAVEFDRKRITSGATGDEIYGWHDFPCDGEYACSERILLDVIYEPVTVVSMFPYAKWLWQSEGYNRWLAGEGFTAELLGGLKGVTVSSIGQSIPLYMSSQGKLGAAYPLSSYVSIMGGTEFGFNFRRTGKGEIVLPDEPGLLDEFGMTDPALGNRYRFAMGMGSYQEQWQTPYNASHRYGLVFAGLSLHFHGSGLFFTGGFAKDGEKNPHSALSAQRFFAEPKIRIKTHAFDFVLGRSMIFDKYSDRNHVFLNVQGINF
ncbi:MAG: hypothetical protein LBU89_08325 [Fibromonadaceae bacterium]|jgi:NTE family protein|nr:hypothetical protein [Fibromonadaceae bacterium]